MPFAIIPFIMSNWQMIVKGIGIALLVFAGWFYFVHNPKVIKELEADKTELARIIEAKDKEITLYKDIDKGKVVIDAKTQGQISSIRAVARPRKSIIIRAGVLLPSMR
jgi:hypothetical protein